MEEIIFVITTLPDQESAAALANALVDERLAACVNVLPSCKSIYRWKGKIENATEVTLLIKTRTDLYAYVQRYITAHHPYELPEVVALPVQAGLPAYLSWVVEETRALAP
jgi:periplasmic divalent cation tolerance protein